MKKRSKGKQLPKLGFGANFMGGFRDLGRGVADFATNTLGMPNVIDSNDYTTGFGKAIGKFNQAAAPFQQIGGQIVANALLPGVGGAALGTAQQIGSVADNRIQQNQQARIAANTPEENPYTQMMYGKGGKIHIKKANRGKFTAYKKRTGKTTEEALHSKDPHVRKMANFAKNAKKWHHKKKHALGGTTEPEYEVEKNEVIQGEDIAVADGNTLATDMTLVGGQTHANGGTDGAGGERVFSDQIVLSDGMTPAKHAEKIGRKKGRMEAKKDSPNRLAKNTANRMLSRYDDMLDTLFQEQEQIKLARQKEEQAAMAPATMPTGMPAMPTMAYGGKTPDEPFDFWKTATTAMNPVATTPLGGIAPGATPFIPNDVMAARTGVNNIPMNNYVAPATTPAAATTTTPVDTVSPNTTPTPAPAGQDKFNWGTALDKSMPYLSNAVSGYMAATTPKVPKPVLNTPAALDTTVDISQQLNDFENMANTSAEAVNQNVANSSVANANRQGLYSKYISGANQLYDNKQKVEQQLRNQDAINKQAVAATNNQLVNNYNDLNTRRTAGIQQDIAKNAANFSEKYMQQGLDAKMVERDRDNMTTIVSMNPDSPQYLQGVKSMGDMFRRNQAFLKTQIDKAAPGTELRKILEGYLKS